MIKTDPKLEEFTADGATLLMLASAIAPSFDRADFDVPLRGSMAEKAEQAAQLFARGIPVGRFEEGGAVRSSDKFDVMAIIGRYRPAGWQQFKAELITLGVCQESDFGVDGLTNSRRTESR